MTSKLLVGTALAALITATVSAGADEQAKTSAPPVAKATASITGSADVGAQIVVLGLDGAKLVVGAVGRADGTYLVENLPAGRYSIKEDRPNHATRTLTLQAGQVGHVDLAPSSK